MKKKIAILAFFVLTGINVFAQNNRFFSMGIGGQFLSGFNGGFESSWNIPPLPPGYTNEKWTYFSGGIYCFFDARYAELNLGFFTGTQTIISEGEPGSWKNNNKDKMTGLNFALLGKYPFKLGEKIAIFPLLGVEYMLILSLEDNYSQSYKLSKSMFNQFWFKAGGGVDFSLSDRWFLRMDALYGIRLATKAENKRAEMNGSKSTLLGHGLTLRAAVGFRL